MATEFRTRGSTAGSSPAGRSVSGRSSGFERLGNRCGPVLGDEKTGKSGVYSCTLVAGVASIGGRKRGSPGLLSTSSRCGPCRLGEKGKVLGLLNP